MVKLFRQGVVLAVPALFVTALLTTISGPIALASSSTTTLEYECPDVVRHDHGLLCNSGFSAVDRGVELTAGRALLWFSRGTQTVHRLWLTDGVRVRFTGRNQELASGEANRAEYRMDQYEIALLGAASLRVDGEELSGERLEYSLSLGRVLGSP